MVKIDIPDLEEAAMAGGLSLHSDGGGGAGSATPDLEQADGGGMVSAWISTKASSSSSPSVNSE